MRHLYNRYIPQSDGSYRRRTVPEQSFRSPAPPPEPHITMPTQEPPPPTCEHCPHKEQTPKTQPHAPESFGFLKSFLPGNFNAEDLLVVMLLLLMCGEHRDNGKLPLLTLALYLFL